MHLNAEYVAALPVSTIQSLSVQDVGASLEPTCKQYCCSACSVAPGLLPPVLIYKCHVRTPKDTVGMLLLELHELYNLSFPKSASHLDINRVICNRPGLLRV